MALLHEKSWNNDVNHQVSRYLYLNKYIVLILLNWLLRTVSLTSQYMQFKSVDWLSVQGGMILENTLKNLGFKVSEHRVSAYVEKSE